MNDPPKSDATEETVEQVDARLRAKYAVGSAHELDAAEYARRVALLVAPPRRAIATFDKHASLMTPAEYRDALKKVGIHRR